MPAKDLTRVPPQALRPYLFHGVGVEWHGGGTEGAAGCPFCGREGKWYVSLETGEWNCFVCGASAPGKVGRGPGGGKYGFLRLLWEESRRATPAADLEALARERGLLSGETPDAWGACKSLLTGRWLLPGYSADGRLIQLYAWLPDRQRVGKHRLLPTPGMGEAAGGMDVPKHGLFAPTEQAADAATTYYCEGPWDGMALWEALGKAKDGGDGALTLTGNPDASLRATSAVVAVPGCTTFYPSWGRPCAGRRAVVCYDNDHPRPHPRTGALLPPAGREGARRVAEILAGAEEPPAEIHFLDWGRGGDHDPDLPSGHDVRDALSAGGRQWAARVAALGGLLGKVAPVPADWVPGRAAAAVEAGGTELEVLPCQDWKTLVNAWRCSGLKWVHGLDKALSVMLAACLSTEQVGDQLWVKVVGPAACGKSTLCEALSTNRRHVVAKSTIRGFHSGFQPDRSGKEDCSLLATLKNKTLVTKDGDTLLQSPNLGQILSEARDVYDRVSRTHYRNKASRDYEGVNMTWLLCGTSSLRQLDQSELGERFLDCVIVDEIDEDLEDEIGWRVINRAAEEVLLTANGRADTREAPELSLAKRLTGGYLGHLRAGAARLLAGVVFPDDAKRSCQRLGKFVAFLRARPSVRQAEKAEREMSFRLVSQLGRLARCLAVVLNRPAVDGAVMSRVREVALDTARGKALEVARMLHRGGARGVTAQAIATTVNETREHEGRLLRFWGKIGVVEAVRFAPRSGPPRQHWRLTPRLEKLYREVTDEREGGGGGDGPGGA